MLAPKAQEHKLLARKSFFHQSSPPPPHLSSQNDQRDVGIILSHRCWVDPPPPRPGRSGTPALNPPSRHGSQGGGWVGKMGLRPPPPPRRAIFFPPCLSYYNGAATLFGGLQSVRSGKLFVFLLADAPQVTKILLWYLQEWEQCFPMLHSVPWIEWIHDLLSSIPLWD